MVLFLSDCPRSLKLHKVPTRGMVYAQFSGFVTCFGLCLWIVCHVRKCLLLIKCWFVAYECLLYSMTCCRCPIFVGVMSYPSWTITDSTYPVPRDLASSWRPSTSAVGTPFPSRWFTVLGFTVWDRYVVCDVVLKLDYDGSYLPSVCVYSCMLFRMVTTV